MESNERKPGDPETTTYASPQSHPFSGSLPPRSTASAPQRAREPVTEASSAANHAIDLGSEAYAQAKEAYSQTKEVVSQAYDKTSEVVGSGYKDAVTYGRENPGKLALLAFGGGVGIGLLVSVSRRFSRRPRRIVGPIATAVAAIADEVFG